MSDLDSQIKIGFEALGANENFRRGLADAIINEAKRRRRQKIKWSVAAVLVLTLLVGVGYSFRNSQIVFGAPPTNSSSPTTANLPTAGGSGITALPFMADLTMSGKSGHNQAHWNLQLDPGNVVEFVSDFREVSPQDVARLSIYYLPSSGQAQVVESFPISSGTSIQEFGKISNSGNYRVELTVTSANYSGRVRFIAIRAK